MHLGFGKLNRCLNFDSVRLDSTTSQQPKRMAYNFISVSFKRYALDFFSMADMKETGPDYRATLGQGVTSDIEKNNQIF